LPVPGGTYYRDYDGVTYKSKAVPATVSSFRLDLYEVTLGRFRAFVDSYPGSRPTVGAGAHPHIPGSGWQPEWPLAPDQAGLRQVLANPPDCDRPTWTPEPGANEKLPIGCLTWYELFAFCAWDDARLPTSAEWGYAAQGGSEQRYFPWSSPPNSTDFDPSKAVYSAYPAKGNPLDVGNKPAGHAKWGHLDAAGNLWDMLLDTSTGGLLVPCFDCATLEPVSLDDSRLLAGGSYAGGPSLLRAAPRDVVSATQRWPWNGARCARDL
jgi:formylglycine-generating enzyme required for sulfatase activity